MSKNAWIAGVIIVLVIVGLFVVFGNRSKDTTQAPNKVNQEQNNQNQNENPPINNPTDEQTKPVTPAPAEQPSSSTVNQDILVSEAFIDDFDDSVILSDESLPASP